MPSTTSRLSISENFKQRLADGSRGLLDTQIIGQRRGDVIGCNCTTYCGWLEPRAGKHNRHKGIVMPGCPMRRNRTIDSGLPVDFQGFDAGAVLSWPRLGCPRRRDEMIDGELPMILRVFGAGAVLVWPRQGCPRRRMERLTAGFQ